MARAGWYDESEYRDYPFQTVLNSNALPQEAIVDFGAIMGPDIAYDDTQDNVYLYSISRTGTVFTYQFRTTASDDTLTFTRDSATAGEFATEWADAGTPWEGSAAHDCTLPSWRGFLVTGRFDALLTAIASGDSIVFPALWLIEPGRIQSLNGSRVQSFNVVNSPRRHAALPSMCDPDEDSTDLVVIARCLQGHIALVEGYNCAIRQDEQNNRLTVSANLGAGKGRQCEEIPIFENEQKPDDSPFYTGGPSCKQILKSINGKGGKHLQIRAGRGIRIYTDPQQAHTLVVDRSLHDFAAFCGSSESSEGA
jgi:hypothetical protein